MRSFGKWLGRVLALIVLAGAALWIFGPYEAISVSPEFDEAALAADPEAYFARREAVFDDITPGVEKRVIWAGGKGVKTTLSLVYIHGFSASSEEVRPVPDRIAAALGANLVYTRLEGHGRDGAALGRATVEGWMTDVAEALAAGRAVGEEVIVLSTSTGGTLVAEAALQPEMMAQVKGLMLISPNFGINDPKAPLLTWPAARYWIPVLAGKTRSFEPRNARQATYWTTSYPTVAVLQMAALVKHAVAQDYAQVRVPALFWYSDADRVVVASETDKVVAQWRGPVTQIKVDLGEGSDPYAHVIAGDIASPPQTEQAVSDMLNWIGGL